MSAAVWWLLCSTTMTAAALASLLTDGTIASRRSACSTSLFFALHRRCSCRRPRSSYRWLAWVVISSRHRLVRRSLPSLHCRSIPRSLALPRRPIISALADQQQAHCSVGQQQPHSARSVRIISGLPSLRRCSIRSSRCLVLSSTSWSAAVSLLSSRRSQ